MVIYMKKDETEQLREKLLDDVYAGAFSGMPAMILEELEEIAKQYGY